MTIPKQDLILYKYRYFDLDGYHLRLLSHSELWFANAKSFNDPFDTSFTYNFDGLHTELAEKWARNAANRYHPKSSSTEKDRIARERLNEIRRDPSYQEEKRSEFIEMNYDTFGICSLSGNMDNLLLWAHYAGQHTGFCVGILMSSLINIMEKLAKDGILLDLYQVKYSTDTPNHNFFKSMINLDDTTHIIEFVTTKSIHWEYEEEYRLIFWDNVNKPLDIGFSAIREVILGCRISEENKKSILSLCRQYLPHVKVMQAVKERTKFALSFEEINID